MAKQNINVGTTANDKKGDSLRAAFQKVNANFTELYTELGLVVDANLNLGAFEFAGSTLSTTDSSAITIDQATTITSDLTVGGDIVPSIANGSNLGSISKPWRSLYVSNNTIYIGGTAVGVDANGNLTVNGSQIAGGGGGSTLVNGANTVSLGSDGVLTLPGGRTRIGASLDSDAIIANEDEAFAVVAQGTNGAVQIVWIEDLENAETSNLAAVYVNSGNLGSVRIATGANGGPGPNYWEFNNSGALTFPQGTTIATADGTDAFLIDGAVDKDVQIYTYSGETARGWSFGTDGSLTFPGDIKSNGNINIDINLADSTLRRWSFGEDGDLVFPDGTNQTTAWTGSTTVSSLVNGSKTVSLDSSLGNLTFTNGEQIRTNVGGIQLYQSDDNTITILPGEVRIKAYGGGGGAKYEWDFDSTGRTTFPNGTVPEHSYGAAGDLEGMVVFTDPYIYYCKSDFRPLVTYTAAVSQTGGSTFEVYQTAGTPLINDHLYGYGVVGEGLITNVQASTEGGQPTWLLTVNQIGGTSIGLTANQPCTIGTPDIWVRVAWTGTNW